MAAATARRQLNPLYRSLLWALTLALVVSTMPALSGCAYHRDDRWLADIESLQRKLPRYHPNLFHNISQDDFHQALEDLKSEVPELSDGEITVRLIQTVAAIGDAHTSIPIPRDLIAEDMVFPVKVDWFSDNLHVIGADSRYRAALGGRVMAINSVPLEDFVAQVNTLIPHENDNWLKARNPALLTGANILQYLGLVDGDQITMTIEFRDGGIENLSFPITNKRDLDWIEAREWSDRPLYQRNRFAFWSEYLPDEKTLYFQYNRCNDGTTLPGYISSAPNFADFEKDLIASLEEHDVDKLVVDLRNNTGGYPHLASNLLKRLARMPLFNQRGKLFVIVGRETFSAGVWHALDLKGSTSALFYGEPTGGKPNFYADIESFHLPYSGLGVTYSRRYFHLTNRFGLEELDDATAFIPDYIITPSFGDYASGSDPVLEAIFHYQEGP